MKTLKKESLFWDVDLKELDAQTHKDFIVKRILSRGDSDDLKWAVKMYGKECLRDLFVRSAHQFDPKSRTFWKLYFSISDETLCIPKQSTDGQSAFSSR